MASNFNLYMFLYLFCVTLPAYIYTQDEYDFVEDEETTTTSIRPNMLRQMLFVQPTPKVLTTEEPCNQPIVPPSNLKVYVADSHVPNIQYEIYAVATLEAAYRLHPYETQETMRAFAELFQQKVTAHGPFHCNNNNWKVISQYSELYLPEGNHFVKLHVESDGKNFTIFS